MGKIVFKNSQLAKKEIAADILCEKYHDVGYTKPKSLEDLKKLNSSAKQVLKYMPIKMIDGFIETKYILKTGAFISGYRFELAGGDSLHKTIYQDPARIPTCGYIEAYFENRPHEYSAYLGLLGLNKPLDVTGFNYLCINWACMSVHGIDAFGHGDGTEDPFKECGIKIYKSIPQSLDQLYSTNIDVKEIDGPQAEIISRKAITTILNVTQINGNIYMYFRLTNRNPRQVRLRHVHLYIKDILLGK